MPRIGDGTGMGGMPPTEEGLRHTGGDSAEKATGKYKEGSGTGPSTDAEGGNQTSPASVGKMS